MDGFPVRKNPKPSRKRIVNNSSAEAQRLETALRWLESHHRRLGIRRKSLEHQLDDLTVELARVGQEIEAATERLRQLKKRQ